MRSDGSGSGEIRSATSGRRERITSGETIAQGFRVSLPLHWKVCASDEEKGIDMKHKPRTLEFVRVWNECPTLDEFCERWGTTKRKAVSLASNLRSQGLTLKLHPSQAASVALVGEVFGKWTVIEVSSGRSRLCRCECGNERIVNAGSLVNGKSKSCCGRPAKRKRDFGRFLPGPGKRPTPTYSSWLAMRNRCQNPEHEAYHNYGGRGIVVCDRWESFDLFLADMGLRPGLEYSLDRFPDMNGNYEPGNCRWATSEEQHNNRRDSRPMTLDGKTMTIAQWARALGMSKITIGARLDDGWTDHEALTTPIDKTKRNKKAKGRKLTGGE